MAKPSCKEANYESTPLFPNEARLRNLTYSAPLYIDITKTTRNGEDDGQTERFDKTHIGKVPIMLRSRYCLLHDMGAQELAELGECHYDQVAYKIVLIYRVVILLSMVVKKFSLLKKK